MNVRAALPSLPAAQQRCFPKQDAGPSKAGVGGAQPSSTRGHRASGKPIYTRDAIKQFYRAHQQSAYNGREAEWARQEADIIRASGEGRILGGVDVAGK